MWRVLSGLTREQRERGFTGSAISVHGPHVAFAWLGYATVWASWTPGCVAVGTNGEVEYLARWVDEDAPREIVIL